MVANGASFRETADTLHVNVSTVARWFNEPEVQEEYRQRVRGAAFGIYSKAVQVLMEQLDHGNPWVRQGAARELMNRFSDQATGIDSREVLIRVEGAPDIGLPEATGNATGNATGYIDDKDADIT